MENSLTELSGPGFVPKNTTTLGIAVLEPKNWIYRLQFAKGNVTFAACPRVVYRRRDE
jgi:hypothetical protein